MTVQLSQPRTDPAGLEDLRPLWTELHRHHRAVADYRDLVEDDDASWRRRRAWYERLLDEGAAYIVALDDERPVGYAMITLTPGPDDTFAAHGGIAEVVTLVVSQGRRGAGIGRALLHGAEEFARGRGIDVVRIAVMSGNARAAEFYESQGYAVAEHLLYRRI
jgi:ribosomal protein S18 acetylase RimI-like enzyme